MNPFTRLFGITPKQPPPQQEPPQHQELPTERKRLPHLHRLKDNKPAFELQDRDLDILLSVLENRFLNADLLKLLFPPNKAKTPPHVFTSKPTRSGTNIDRRLSKLFHHGYLHRIRTDINGKLFYALTSKGAQLIADRQLPLPFNLTLLTDWEEKNRDLSHHYLEHTVMVSRFFTSLICGGREHPTIQLTRYEREGEGIKEEWRSAKQSVLVFPDAFCVLHDATKQEHPTAYFLEADRGSMRLARVLEKYKRYSLLHENRHAYGLQNFSVLTVCKSKERARNILQLAAAEISPIPQHLKKFFFFTSEERYKDAPSNVFAQIWWRGDEYNPSHGEGEEPTPLRSILRADPLRRR